MNHERVSIILPWMLGIAWLLCPVTGLAQGEPTPPIVEAQASVDKAVATTGDILEYTLTVKHTDDVDVAIPEQGAEIAGFRIIDFGRHKPSREGNRNVVSLWYKLRGDLVGSYILPKTTVTYRPKDDTDADSVSIETSEIFVEIQSVLPQDGSATDIRDIKPLRRIDRPTPLWVWGLGVGIVALILGIGWWLRRKNRVEHVIPPPPAHEVAFEALNHLRNTDFNDEDAMRSYYFRLSEVLRTYIEGRFSMNATDLTTEELVPQIQTRLPVETQLKDQLTQFLRSCDHVKYAHVRPTDGDIERVYETALSFVEATVPIADPSTEPAS